MPHSQLLHKLADLTSIRDQEVLELSMMKTLEAFVHPEHIAIYKFSKDSSASSVMTLKDGEMQLQNTDVEIPDVYQAAFDALYEDKIAEYHAEVDGMFLSAAYLLSSHFYRAYLVFTTPTPLEEKDSYLITGLLQIYRNYCSLLEDSQRDQLTGLANRAIFDEHINRIVEVVSPDGSQIGEYEPRPSDEGLSAWIVMIDVDHFKKINDTYGHLYGDEVLVLLSRTMMSFIRKSDRLFRYGGEEFVLIARCADRPSAEGFLERLRQQVEAQDFPQVGKVTVSIGAVEFQRKVFPVTLMDYADQALYESKRNGRNQVTFFEDMIADGRAVAEDIEGGEIELF